MTISHSQTRYSY